MSFQSPGHYITESRGENIKFVTGGAGVGAFVGFANWGPIGKAERVNSFEDAKKKYGDFKGNYILMYALQQYFKEGGTYAYVSRTAHYTDITNANTLTAVKSNGVLQNTSPADVLKAYGKYEGERGNFIKVKAEKTNAANTVTTQDLTDTENSIEVVTIKGIYINSHIDIDDGSNSVLCKVTDISGKTVYIERVGTQSATIGSGATVKSRDFKLTVYFKNDVVETWENVSMYSDDAANYCENVINDNSNYITVEDLAGSLTEKEPVGEVVLSGGNDGYSGIADTDLIGSRASKTGLYAFDEIDDILLLSVVEMQTVSIGNAIISYTQSSSPKKYAAGIIDIPVGSNKDNAIDFIVNQGGFASNSVATFFSNLLAKDVITGATKTVPASADVLGKIVSVTNTAGKGPYTAVAGVENGVLTGITGLESKEQNDKGVRDELYPDNINPIYFKKGYGYLIYGVRTLEIKGGDLPQLPQRLTMLYVEKTVDDNTQWVEFSNNDAALAKKFIRSVKGFLKEFWKGGGLLGATEEEAYSIIVDEASIGTNLFKAKIGLNLNEAVEFVWLDFSRKTNS